MALCVRKNESESIERRQLEYTTAAALKNAQLIDCWRSIAPTDKEQIH